MWQYLHFLAGVGAFAAIPINLAAGNFAAAAWSLCTALYALGAAGAVIELKERA